MQQFSQARSQFQTPSYQAVQSEYWDYQRRTKRSAPTPAQSAMTTPQEGDVPMQTGAQDPEQPPSLVQPFAFEEATAVGLTAAEFGVNINDHTAVNAWLLEPVQNKKQMMAMMSAYHRKVIRPEYYNLVLQLESALKTIDDKVFVAKRELEWMASENRQAQKHHSGLQIITSGWPNYMKPEQRHYMLNWMFSTTPKIRTFVEARGFTLDGTANELGKFMNVLQQDPVTIPQQDQFYSTMTMLTFKSWDTRSAFLERFGGSSGTPLYQDESTPVQGKRIRVTPAAPQWQRKLELPLRVLIACINAYPDHTSSTRLTILWKTLTLMEPAADLEFKEDAKAWARLFYSSENGKFVGRLEVTQELFQVLNSAPTTPHPEHETLWMQQWNAMVWGSSFELDQAEAASYTQAKAESGTTGKGISKGKGKRHWSSTMVHNSYFCPYPFELQVVQVSAVAYCWDELCDKKNVPQQKVGDYGCCTFQGKPAPPTTPQDDTLSAAASAFGARSAPSNS